MRRLLLSSIILGITSVLAFGATTAYFSDTEISSGNTFTAGTLDLKINGGDTNVSYTFSNMAPVVSQPNITYRLRNAGTITGYLNIRNINISSTNDWLYRVLHLRLMHDANCSGWHDSGEAIFFNNYAVNIVSQYLPNIVLTPGQETCINVLVNWWSTPNDNLAQGDDMTLDMEFELHQAIQSI